MYFLQGSSLLLWPELLGLLQLLADAAVKSDVNGTLTEVLPLEGTFRHDDSLSTGFLLLNGEDVGLGEITHINPARSACGVSVCSL